MYSNDQISCAQAQLVDNKYKTINVHSVVFIEYNRSTDINETAYV